MPEFMRSKKLNTRPIPTTKKPAKKSASRCRNDADWVPDIDSSKESESDKSEEFYDPEISSKKKGRKRCKMAQPSMEGKCVVHERG